MTTVHRAQLVVESTEMGTGGLMSVLETMATRIGRAFGESVTCLVVDMEDEVKD